jgi:uncharacterized membrane protein
MWYAYDGMGWWMLFGGVFWLFLIAAIMWVAFQLLGRASGSRADALEHVKGRYARGEISRKEFQRIVQDLTHVATERTHDVGGGT